MASLYLNLLKLNLSSLTNHVTLCYRIVYIMSFSNTLSSVVSVSGQTLLVIQIKRAGGKAHNYSKRDEVILNTITPFLELKLCCILQRMETKAIEGKLSTFVGMEGALLSEKTYYEFYKACQLWLPKICPFSFVSIIFYDPNGTLNNLQ